MRARNWLRNWPMGSRPLTSLRQWYAWLNGDAAYTRYLAHLRSEHPGHELPTRAAFYRMEVERRWNGVCRCC